jgi:uroporphyrinogen decarboxylase
MSRPALAPALQPDVGALLGVIRRQRPPRRVHNLELFLDPEVKDALSARFGLEEGLDRADPRFALRREVRLHAFLGYDVFRLGLAPKKIFDLPQLAAADTTAGALSRGQRDWTEEHTGPIRGWRDFEAYPWPRVRDIDLSPLEWLDRNLPENMGVYDLTAHVLEMISFLLGYEGLCYLIHDDPALVRAVAERIGAFYVDWSRTLADFRCVPFLWGSDDMGFRTSTMVSPAFLRELVLPWHRACAEAGRARGKPYLLHACGDLSEIMEDLIGEVGIDGKHSFEDGILPVAEAYRRYGDRISVLGASTWICWPAAAAPCGRACARRCRPASGPGTAWAIAWARATRWPTTCRWKTTWLCWRKAAASRPSRAPPGRPVLPRPRH